MCAQRLKSTKFDQPIRRIKKELANQMSWFEIVSANGMRQKKLTNHMPGTDNTITNDNPLLCKVHTENIIRSQLVITVYTSILK